VQPKTGKSAGTSFLKDHFDNNNQVFIKLYKKLDSTFLYWETWSLDDKSATIHFGQLGNLGQQLNVGTASNVQLKEKINSAINRKIAEGYAEIPLEKQFTVTITFRLETWGIPADLDRREQIRNILTEHLGWTGNGACNDGDIGSGEMTLYADVIDPYLAVMTISKEFKAKNVREEYHFGITQGDSIIADPIVSSKE
jgi:hypothetical protein